MTKKDFSTEICMFSIKEINWIANNSFILHTHFYFKMSDNLFDIDKIKFQCDIEDISCNSVRGHQNDQNDISVCKIGYILYISRGAFKNMLDVLKKTQNVIYFNCQS